MTDYREIYHISELAKETDDGTGVRVAVLDTGIPESKDIFVCRRKNFTTDTSKDSGHATFVCSILFGRGDIRGICSNATACLAKVFDKSTAKPDIVAAAINHAVDVWEVDIINLSLGFSRAMPCPEILKKACLKAYEKGVLIVAASGNDGGETMWPAALPETICVGSADCQGKSSFSNYGEVDFVVPGTDLVGLNPNGTTVKKSGTSFSTAIITGMLTLLLARRRRSGLKTDIQSIKKELASYCLDLEKEGWDPNTGYGYPFALRKTGYLLKFIIHYVVLPIKRIYATIKKTIRRVIRL